MREFSPLMLEFLNVVVKSVLREAQFKQIGKLPKFFLPSERVQIPQHSLEMWPGYLTTSRLLADGIFLNMDTCTKFINKVTCLD